MEILWLCGYALYSQSEIAPNYYQEKSLTFDIWEILYKWVSTGDLHYSDSQIEVDADW